MERYKDGKLEDLGSILDGLGDDREYELDEGPSWNDIGNPSEDLENCAKRLREGAGVKKEEPYVDASNYKEVIQEMNRRRDG